MIFVQKKLRNHTTLLLLNKITITPLKSIKPLLIMY
jgi:hypothetical protein